MDGRRPVGSTGQRGMAQLHQAAPLVERLHALVEHLTVRAPRATSGPALARRLGVSTRTVERDIARLVAAGVPVETTRGSRGGYRLAIPRHPAPITLSTAELAALIATLTAVGPYTSAAARSALTKLVAATAG